MIGICAPRCAPALLKDAPHRIVEHLLGGATGASVLTHRLLGVDRPDCCIGAGGAHGLNVPGGGRSHPIAEAERGLTAKCRWAEPGQSRAQRGSVLGRTWAKQHALAYLLPGK